MEEYRGYNRRKMRSQDNRIKQRRAWLLLGWVTAERYCPCKQLSCSSARPLVFRRLSVREDFLPYVVSSYLTMI
ncbi:hypothetical protein J6590_024953 [Homalodisca vitripennis]|nr:hypothetical protein J6590_024953 [Homalodisca vitripennis]